MSFYKGDAELLLIDAIKHKPYKDLAKIKEDLLTYLKFKYPVEEFKETIAFDSEYFSGGKSGKAFLKSYLEDIIVDFHDIFKITPFEAKC